MMISNRRGDQGETAADRYGGPVLEQQRHRGKVVFVALMLCLVAVCGRLAQLHLNPDLELSEEERTHIGMVTLQEPRGKIFDRNGLVLATNRDVPSLWVDPRKVTKPEELALTLSAELNLPLDQTFERLTATESNGNPMKFMWVKRWLTDVSPDTIDQLIAESHGALAVKYESTRYYPQGETAAHLLGFVNRVGEASEGVELLFDHHLKSVPGQHKARKDAGRRLLESLTLDYTPPTGGDSIQLTLESSIQHTLETALDRRIVECNAASGMGIVMDPKTGAILALACRPAYDPNLYTEFDPALRKNRALVDRFEPGSAFKIVTAAAALEHGIVTPDTMIDCENGGFNPYGHRIKDFHSLGVEPFRVCFEQSSNVAIIKVAAQLGPERLDQWIRRFGFGATTSRDFTLNTPKGPMSLETSGIYRPREKWSRLTMGSLPMGQEIAVTLIQLAKSFSVIANGGYVVEPYYVERAVNRNGETTYQFPHGERQRILSPETAKTMQELCKQVVDTGTGAKADIDEYTVAGKTGTAQMARKDGRGYDPDRFTTVFSGFAPANNPAVVSVIVIQEPMIRLHYGGYVCGPVFKEVVREALVRLNVPPDRPENAQKPEEKPEEKSEKKRPAEDADTIVARLDIQEQEMLEDSLENLLEPLDGLALIAPMPMMHSGEPLKRLPDLVGMNKRQAAETLRNLGIPWDVKGSGWVTSQYPPAGTPIYEVLMCSLEFARKASDEEALDATQPVEGDAVETNDEEQAIEDVAPHPESAIEAV